MTLVSGKKLSFIIVLMISCYYLTIFLFAVDFPISDDFALIDFLNHYTKAAHLKEKISLLFNQHNEHRIVTTRVVFLIYHKLTGTLNFKYLCIIGNLAILGIFFILAKQVKKNWDKKGLIIFITTCMLFQYGSAESMLWAMASISNYYVLFFILITLEFLTRDRIYNFTVAILFAFLASFTQGNGLAILIVGGLYLLGQKRFRHLLVWACLSSLIIYCYFNGYQPSENALSFSELFLNFFKISVFMLAFIGSAFGIGGSHYPIFTNICLIPTTLIGLCVCVTTVYMIYKGKYKDGNILIWINLFIIFTSFSAAISRSHFGLSQALVSRYHINSSVAIISSIILLYQHLLLGQKETVSFSQKISKLLPFGFIFYTILTFSMIFYFSFKVYLPARNGEIIFHSKEKAIEIIDDAREIRVYKTPNR